MAIRTNRQINKFSQQCFRTVLKNTVINNAGKRVFLES